MTVFKPYQTFSLSKGGPWVLFGIWVMVQIFTFQHYGIVEAIDSDFYLSQAQALLQGHLPADRGIWYISYSVFLALVLQLGGSLATVVGLQFLFSGIAAFFLYKAVLHLFQDYTIAFLAVLQYLLWIKIHQWNSYIYTESLFISFSILSFALLCLSRSVLHYFITALLILFTLFLRPTGICFFIGLCGYFIYWLSNKKDFSKPIVLGSAMGLVAALMVSVNIILEEYIYYFIDSYRKAEIIYPNIHFLIQAPALDLPSPSAPPLFQLISFIFYNPIYFLKLAALKGFLFWANVKPYFSWAHNLAIAFILYPIYGLAIYGFQKFKTSKEHVFMSAYILMQFLTVSMTSENWDGRFLILILPFVFIYAAFGTCSLLKKWEQRSLNGVKYKGP